MLGARARITIVPPYIIIYDHNHTAVSILRVLHGKQHLRRFARAPFATSNEQNLTTNITNC
jgi:plasmid stabilization system protein ParE